MEDIERKLRNQGISEDSGICNEGGSESISCETAEEKTNNIEAETKDENEQDNEEVVKVVAQKGVSITRALIMFGFESWSALEPGKSSISLFFRL